jgi:hypothetical protein
MCQERRQSAVETTARAPAGALGDGPGTALCRRAGGNRTVFCVERNRAVRRVGALGHPERCQETLPARLRDALSALLLHPVSSLASLLARRERETFRADVFSNYEASLDTLSDAERSALSRHWLRRARSEARISAVFSKMIPLLREVRATDVVVSLIALSAADELRHSEVCVHVAERYAGRGLEPAPVGETPLPAFGCEDERLEIALLLTGTCCINETLATVWLTLGIEAARTPLTRAAHRAHLRDEVDHARAGWAHLASDALDRELRAAVGACLPRLLAANLPLWLEADPLLPAEGVRDHGAADHISIDRCIRSAVREILLPGFEHVGVPVGQECRRTYGSE